MEVTKKDQDVVAARVELVTGVKVNMVRVSWRFSHTAYVNALDLLRYAKAAGLKVRTLEFEHDEGLWSVAMSVELLDEVVGAVDLWSSVPVRGE